MSKTNMQTLRKALTAAAAVAFAVALHQLMHKVQVLPPIHKSWGL